MPINTNRAADHRFPASPSPSFASSSRYRVIAPIGRERLAEVLLAEARVGAGARRLAVLKRMWGDLAADPELSSLFLNEGRQAARLNHPQIVQTYELLDDAHRPMVALEYLEGQSLARVLDRLVGPNSLSLSLRLHIVSQVLAALEYAHDLTDLDGSPGPVIHGDISPHNVFITYAGQVKLLNFRAPANGNPKPGVSSGGGDGQVAYLAPEQVAGLPVDGRTDLFSVGVMLWEMAAGRRLWQGVPDREIIRHLNSRIPIPPFERAAQLPHGLESMCARALARDPANRYVSAADFGSHIASVYPEREHARAGRLGNVVSRAFQQEREARRALIEASLRQSSVANGPVAQAASAPGEGDAHEGDAVIDPVMLLDPSFIISISTEDVAVDGAPLPASPPRANPVPPPLPKTATVAAPVHPTDATKLGRRKQRSRLPWAGGGVLVVAAVLVVASGRLWPASHAGANAVQIAPPISRTTSTPAVAAATPAAPAPSVTPIISVIPAVKDEVSPGVPSPSAEATRSRKRARRAQRPYRHEDHDTDRIEPVPTFVQDDAPGDDILRPSFDLSGGDAPPPGSAFAGKAVSPQPAATVRRLASRPIDTSDPFQP